MQSFLLIRPFHFTLHVSYVDYNIGHNLYIFNKKAKKKQGLVFLEILEKRGLFFIVI